MNKSHGSSGTRLYRIWLRAKQEGNDYKNHFSSMRRQMCDEWESDFSSFATWAHSHGYTDSLFLKRRSKFKGYNPENCYWGPRTGRLYPDDLHATNYRQTITLPDTVGSIVNSVFGKLVVIREVPREMRKPGRRAFVCRCACGNEVTVLASNLLSGATKSCGCMRNRSPKVTTTDTGNIRAGRLTILERFEDNNVVKYRCVCDCGKMVGVPASDLFSGRVTSCGCSVTPVQQQTPASESNPLENWDNF